MSQIQRSMLRMVDWTKVRMICIDGAVIRLVTEEGLKRFPFASEDAARDAFEEWIKDHPSVEKVAG